MDAAAQQSREYIDYEDEGKGFRFSYVKGWTIEDEGPGLAVVLMAPRSIHEREAQGETETISADKSGHEAFRDNLTIVCQRVATPELFGLGAIAENSHIYLQRILPDFKMLSVEGAELGGMGAKRIEYTGSVRGKHQVRFSQYVTIMGERAYALTYSASIDTFSEHLDDVRGMVESFRIL